MKLKKIYSNDANSIADMSKDKFVLTLTYNEYIKLKWIIEDCKFYSNRRNKIAKKFDEQLRIAESNYECEWV